MAISRNEEITLLKNQCKKVINVINREGVYCCAEFEPMNTHAKNKLLFEVSVLEERIKDLRKEIENA